MVVESREDGSSRGRSDDGRQHRYVGRLSEQSRSQSSSTQQEKTIATPSKEGDHLS